MTGVEIIILGFIFIGLTGICDLNDGGKADIFTEGSHWLVSTKI